METNKIIPITNQQSDLKNSLIDHTSRYQKSDLLFYSQFQILTFETYDRLYNPATVTKKISDVRFYLITQGTQYKPWLVSNDAYGDPGYWWLIMEFNNLFDIEEFESGKTIKIPPITIVQ